MIKGIGIDAVELPRITRLIEEKPKFIARILTSDENGQPVVTRSPHEGNVWVSITHTNETAFAQIILED